MKTKSITLRIERPLGATGSRRYVIRLFADRRFWIEVVVDKNGRGVVTSNLQHKRINPGSRRGLEMVGWNLQMQTVETLLLGLACAGVDIDSPEALQGINAAMQHLVNSE